jgi:hypothetical protein
MQAAAVAIATTAIDVQPKRELVWLRWNLETQRYELLDLLRGQYITVGEYSQALKQLASVERTERSK